MYEHFSRQSHTATLRLEEDALPFIDQKIAASLLQKYIELKKEVETLKVMIAEGAVRETKLREENEQKDAIIRDLRQRLYGKKSEAGKDKGDINSNDLGQKADRSRGQQKCSASHGRTQRPNLPIISEFIPVNETTCSICGLEYAKLSDEESDIIEIDVKAHIRRIKRQKWIKRCSCPGAKVMIAPLPLKLIPKSPYGSSVWGEIILRKFLHAQPVNRTLDDFKNFGLDISPGTIAGGLRKLKALFVRIHKAFHSHQMTESRFHNDETRWEVYERIENKVGHRWYLWVTRSASVVYYRIDPTRSADVPIEHFADLISKTVIVVCDRYSAYKKLARLNLAIILAFCWAHVRRDFLTLARRHPDLNKWGLDWAAEISNLFHLNNLRVEVWDPNLSLSQQSDLFEQRHKALGVNLDHMKSRALEMIEKDDKSKGISGKPHGALAPEQRKVLVSLCEHWQGLTVFFDHPEVKMDNNLAEQSIRNPVLGRNDYYGSGSLWSAELAAMLFSIFQTMLLWKLNPRTWLSLYFEACARNKGQPPEDLNEFLPWKMNKEQLLQFSKPLDNTS